MAEENPWLKYIPQTAPQAAPQAAPKAAPAGTNPSMERYRRHAAEVGLPMEWLDAFAGQESSGGSDTRDSVQGARGALQITKGRFLDAGGKNFGDEEDVARTAVTELNRMRLKYNGNPKAVAASWHSHPSNVNPDGSLKKDTKDGLGKRTADYQTDIEKRMSGVTTTSTPLQDNPWAKYLKEYQDKNAPPSPLTLGATKAEPEGTDYTYGDAAYAGLVTGKLTLDVAANALAGFFGADQAETKRILAETLKEYSSLKKDPAMEKLVTQVKDDAATSSFGPTVGAILNLPKAVVKSDDPINLMGHFMVTQIIPSLPGFVLGAGAGAAFSRAAMQKAVTNELVKKGVSTAVAGATGNAMAVMTSALGSNYAEGMRKFGDHQQAQDYAVRKTLAEVPANALAGSVMGMKLGPNAITNILAQAVVQGTGGAVGAARASNAVGEEADPAELALEFWGEFASAPVEAAQAGVSAAMGPRTQASPEEAPPAAGQPPTPPAAPAQAAPAAGMQPAPADPALPAFEVYTGNGTNVATPTGLQVGAQFGVADASSLITAFTPTGQANPRYQLAPGANRVNQVGADPERLGASELSSEGAPVVGNDGRVESGNNRLNAIRRAYQTAQGAAYKQWLLSNLEQFGIPESSRSAIEAMEQPALIRLRVTPVDRNQFVTESNAQPAPAAPEMGQPAQATPQPAEPDSEMTYDRAIQVGKMASELGPAYGAQGTVNWTPGPLTSGTIEGLHRVRAEAQARLEEADPGATAVPDILQAAVDVATIRAQGLDVAEVLAHMEALGEEFSPEAIALIQALDEANGNPARVADLVRGLISKEQKSRTTAEIIRAQAKELRKKYGLQGTDAGGEAAAGAAPEGGATEAPVDSAPELPGAREAGGQADEAVAEEPARAAGGTQFSRSLTGKDTALTSFWTMLAKSEDLFKVPLFADEDMTKLAAKIDPAMKVFKYPVPFSKRLKANYEITMPDGKTADVMHYKDGAIVLDASRLVEGSSGGWKLYALLFNFALNNKAVFIGDPAGLSDAALFRRTENMISAALKAGTTAHMYPHERQVAEGLKWEESNRLSDDERTAVNLQNLLDFSVYLVSKTFPEINDFRYNPESGKFDGVSDGSELSEEVLGRALESPGAREARIGRATLARAIVSATALREGRGEGGKPGGFGHQLLASALRQLRAGAVDPALEGSMYSRAGDTAGPVSTQDVEATIAPYRARATGLPNVVVVQSQTDRRIPADLAKLIAREAPGSVAGAYHNGEIFLFADNLRDSDHAAFTFLHEAEHHGLAMLLGPEYDAVMMAIWEGNPAVQLAAGKLIRQHRLSRVDAVKEVLADWAGEGKHPTILQRLIAAIRDVARKAGLRLKMNDADVLALIARGKDAWKKGVRRNSHIYSNFSQSAPMFYSQMAGVIGEKGSTATSAEWKRRLDAWASSGAYKRDELEWSGLREWLDLQEGKVTTDAVLGYLRDNHVRVEETVLGERARWRQRRDELRNRGMANLSAAEREELMSLDDRFDTDGPDSTPEGQQTKFGEYTLPGGTNYREVLLTLPERRPLTAAWRDAQNRYGDDDQRTRAAKMAARSEAKGQGGKYIAPHWDQSNVLVHVRLVDRIDADGNKVLFVEEIQSDWAQEGRKKGFDKPASAPMGWADTGSATSNGNIPSAPFVTKTDAWVSLALKRVMRMAAEGGYDRVAFVTGSQAADRFRLSNQVESISYVKRGDVYQLWAVSKEGNQVRLGDNNTESELAAKVGKEMAERIVRGEGVKSGDATILRGVDLEVGGDGMKAFYDKIVPSAASALLKKLGGKMIASVELPRPNASRRDEILAELEAEGGNPRARTPRLQQPGFEVTDEMREKVMGGLPLFSRNPKVDKSSVDANVPRASVEIMIDPNGFKERYDLKPKRNNVREVATALERRTRERFGVISDTDTSVETAKEIAKAIAAEVKYQLANQKNSGLGWYSKNYPKALTHLGRRYPELRTSKAARGMFTAFLAITSNGERVQRNMAMAIELYEAWREGRPLVVPGAKRGDAMANAIETVEGLLRRHGPGGMQKILLEEMSVRDINAELRRRGEKTSSEYQADMLMPRAALYFGPKLGAFFANLSGSHGYLTMDLWWSRSFNRYRGLLLTTPTAGLMDRFRSIAGLADAPNEDVLAAVKEPRDAYKARNYQTELELLIGRKEGKTKAEKEAFMREAQARATPAMIARHSIEKSANSIYKDAFEALNEAPFRATDREFMLNATLMAQRLLKGDQVDITVADIQAALWYYEKQLYAALGTREAGDIGYLEAIENEANTDRPERPAARVGREPARQDDDGGVAGLRGGDPEFLDIERPDASRDRRDGGSAEPVYSKAERQPDAVSAVAVHYSREQRSQLLGSYYGTGLKGAEAARLQNADPRLRSRIYFYASTGQGVRPEAGVGPHAHTVRLENLYDLDADPRGWRGKLKDSNAVEVAVLDAGFDGYIASFGEGQKAVVLLGNHSVPVAYRGMGYRGQGLQAAQSAEVAPEEQALRDFAKERRLPSGSMAPSQWRTITERVAPELFARLPEGLFSGEGTFYRDELISAFRRQESFQDLDPSKIEALIASWAGNSESRRVHVIPALRRAIKLYQSDQDGSAWIQIQSLLDRLEQKTAEGKMRDMRRERVRGLDWVKERLLRARRTGELQTTTVDFTLWALEQNPALAEDLGISIRERGDNVAGQYNPASRVITLVAGAFNTTTGVHEILHHAERMMPDEVQAGIEKGWAMAFARAMKKANEKRRKALADMFGAMAGDIEARKRVMAAFEDGTLDYDEHYQLVNPSEFWAVNATRYMEARYNAVTWVQRAKQWMREMIQKLKTLLRLPSDAPVLRGLEAVLKSDGSRQTKTMIAQRAGARVTSFMEIDRSQAVTPTQRRRSYVATSKRAIERIDRALTPLGSLPSVRKYLARRGIALGEIAQADNVGRSLYDAFAKRDAEVQQQVYEYLTTAEADPNDITDPDARREAVRAKELIDQVGQDLVGYGLLSMEAYEANRGAYLPRLYLKHLLSDQDNKAIGTGKKPSDLGYLKKRKDIPKEIRDVVLGEVKDPGYLSTVGYTRATRDMALLDWLHDISLNDEWVYRKDLVEWEGQRVTAFWLKNEADRIRRQIPYYTGEVAKRANELVARMDALVNPVLDELGKVPADYRQMPDTPRYGRLRGMYVRKEIYEDIVGIGAVVSKDAGWAEKLLGYGGWATRATQFWKTMKVAMNPPGQIRNFLSNAILLQLSGVGLHRVPMRLAQAAAQIREERKIEEEGRALTLDEEERLKHWLVAKKYGLTVGTFSSQELYRAEREFLDLQARMRGPNSFMHLINIGAKVMDFAGDIYQFSEAIFKTAKIIDEMERGQNEVDAANEAQKWLFDYSLVSQSVRYLRNAPVGAPFITFAAKVAPRMLEVALHAPWRFAPWVALAYTFPMIVASMGGPDEEDQEKLKKLLPDAWKDKGHVYVLPWKDEAGRWQVLDLSYLMPWTMFTSAGKQLARGDVQEATQTMGLVGGPLPDIITAWKTGKDPFTQRDIVQKGDPLHLQLGALLTYVYNMAAPPILTDRGLVGPSLGDPAHSVGGKLPSALRGSTNRYGDPVSTLPQAAAGAVGFNVRSVDPVMDRAKKVMEKRRELDDVKARLKQALMDRALSKDERAKIVQTYLEEIKRRNQKLQEFSEATR